MTRLPLPSAGSPWGGFPCFAGTMSSSDCLPSFPRARCLAPRLPPRASCFAPVGTTRGADEPGLVHRVALPDFGRRRQALPGSWGTPICARPRSRTPERPPYQAIRYFGAADGPRGQARLSRCQIFRGSIRGSRTPCVRFAAEVTLAPRNTRFRLVATLCRAGLVACWVPLKVSVRPTSSFFRLSWRPLPDLPISPSKEAPRSPIHRR
jgi:hypothetical protein